MKVLITPRSFGQLDPSLFSTLEEAGLEVVRNSSGDILDRRMMKHLISDCDAVIVGLDPLDKEVLDAAPGLLVVSNYGVGVDNIDLAECARRGIVVTRTEHATDEAVADYAMGMMLAVARRIVSTDRQCRAGNWHKATGVDMYGQTLGIIGLGAIGQRVALRARGFAMRVLASDPYWDEDLAADLGITRSDPDEICATADFISLHCDLNEATRGLIDRARIASMKENAVLVNTARGGLVDEAALLDALEQKRIFGAGLDVFGQEPPADTRWRTLDNVVLAAHCGSGSFGCVRRMGSMAVANLLQALRSLGRLP